MKINVLIALLLITIAGCAVGPDYKRPQLDIPKEFVNDDSLMISDSLSLSIADTSWWSLFQDSVLTDLIHTAVKENTNILVASSRVEQYMALYGVAKSDMYPQIFGKATTPYGQFSSVNTGTEKNPTRAIFNIGISADWELDIWGKIKRSKESASAELLASEESRKGIILMIASQVASAYIDLLSLKKQLEIANNTVESRDYSIFLFKLRLARGDISDLELIQLESEFWVAKSKIPFIEKKISQLETAISILLGRNPGKIKTTNVLDNLIIPEIPTGIPSALLERRPDIKQAEQKLISANAKIGVVKSMYYPSISLSGILGLASNDLTTILDPQSRIWNIGGSITAPIFTGGKVSNQVKVAESVKKELLLTYIQTIRNAFKETEDAFSDRYYTQEQLAMEKNIVESLLKYKELADLRYREGVTSYLEVLDAERSLFSAQLQYADTQASLLKSVVNIYKALAGSWLEKLSKESLKK